MTFSQFMAGAALLVALCSASKVMAQDSRLDFSLSEDDVRIGRIIEKQLANWKRDKENNATPRSRERGVVGDLSGIWQAGGGRISSTLRIFPVRSNVYSVIFITSSCGRHWVLGRTGVYKNGVLILNRPVREAASFTYDRLFTIRTSQGIRLISDAALARSRELREATPESYWMFTNTTPWLSEAVPAKKKAIAPSPVPRARLL